MMNAWRPVRYQPAGVSGPSLGQTNVAFKVPTSVTGIGGIVLLSTILSNMLVSTDQRPATKVARVLGAGFAAYLVIDQSFYRLPPSESSGGPVVALGLPALGVAAVIAALTGAGYLIFRKKGQ